ncbi:hypothetical protein [Actinomadura rubrisoli]|nr:hypothetical protein [Actinomadura rubrisoli]
MDDHEQREDHVGGRQLRLPGGAPSSLRPLQVRVVVRLALVRL